MTELKALGLEYLLVDAAESPLPKRRGRPRPGATSD